MTLDYINIIEKRYSGLGYKPYTWVVNTDPPPFTQLSKPLSECRLGLVASGGVYVAGQTAFHWKDDVSFRKIPTNVKTHNLRASHFAYDLNDARTDPNVVFPIDTLRSLVKEGVIGELADHAYTFMGGIYSARRVRDELAPRITDKLLAEQADVVLFVPV